MSTSTTPRRSSSHFLKLTSSLGPLLQPRHHQRSSMNPISCSTMTLPHSPFGSHVAQNQTPLPCSIPGSPHCLKLQLLRSSTPPSMAPAPDLMGSLSCSRTNIFRSAAKPTPIVPKNNVKFNVGITMWFSSLPLFRWMPTSTVLAKLCLAVASGGT